MEWPTKKQIANGYLQLTGLSIIGVAFFGAVYLLIDHVGILETTGWILLLASIVWALIHAD